ncbi:MAG: multiheme c-type cytochrome [Planctomycetota bacterium]
MNRVGRTTGLTLLATGLITASVIAGLRHAGGAETTVQSGDPPIMVPEEHFAAVQGAKTCGDCHLPEYEAWKESQHYATFKTRHLEDRSREIWENLELKGMMNNDRCFKCHYTSQIVDGERQSIHGVSCESCHGAGKNWTSDALHHEKAAKAPDDAARMAIQDQCTSAGMIRPANIAAVARNCFACHTVPDEELVNKGTHTPGSDFDLVSWLEGEVRHNYQYADETRKTPGTGKNRVASANRKRVLYVVGCVTDLEYAIRGMANITEKGVYRKAMQSRKNDASEKIDAILAKVDIPEIGSVIAAQERDKAGGVKVTRSNLKTLPGELAAAVDKFVDKYDGSTLAALDGLMSKGTQGTAQP